MPGALPSIRISRGCTTTASATSGLVMAMRVTSKSVVTTVERPAVSCTCGNESAAFCGVLDAGCARAWAATTADAVSERRARVVVNRFAEANNP